MAEAETISLEIIDPIYYLDEEVTYARTDAWFGHVTRDLRMDIIYPQTDKKKYPCIIWICGGAWTQVSKNAHLPYLTDLARRGFVVASVDYRLGHEAGFPGALIDIKAAIRYLRAHSKRYSINIEKFGVAGESAGGYLAAMTALTRNKEFEEGDYLEYSSDVQAACPWYMPCDLPGLFKRNGGKLQFFSGDIDDKQYCDYINPLSYVTPNSPPFLLLHGEEDTLVPVNQSYLIFNALVAKKVDAKLIVIKDAEHAAPQFFQRPLWDIVADFFLQKLV